MSGDRSAVCRSGRRPKPHPPLAATRRGLRRCAPPPPARPARPPTPACPAADGVPRPAGDPARPALAEPGLARGRGPLSAQRGGCGWGLDRSSRRRRTITRRAGFGSMCLAGRTLSRRPRCSDVDKPCPWSRQRATYAVIEASLKCHASVVWRTQNGAALAASRTVAARRLLGGSFRCSTVVFCSRPLPER